MDARADLRDGKLITETAGFQAPWLSTNTRLLRERYGIELRMVAGCVVTPKILGHIHGYNEVMDVEIERRFGRNVFERTATEAERIGPHN